MMVRCARNQITTSFAGVYDCGSSTHGEKDRFTVKIEAHPMKGKNPEPLLGTWFRDHGRRVTTGTNGDESFRNVETII